MVDYPGCFAWYELMTTDVGAAEAFYRHVVGWGVQDASTPDLPYTLFTAAKARVGGLMNLPEEGRKMGATPRWMGYVGVNDVEVTASRIRAPRWHRLCPTDQHQYRPYFGCRRSAKSNICFGQRAEACPANTRRVRQAGACGLA